MTAGDGPGRHIALLRGVNVGGHNRLPMADLRARLTAAGFADVETYIQSGNIALTSTAPTGTDCLPESIAAVIAEYFDLDIPVVTRTAEQLAAVIEGNPFPDAEAEPKRLHVFFCDATPDPGALDSFDHEAYRPDRFAARGAELYVAYQVGIGSSKLDNTVIERALGVRTTARNWSTVLRLADMAGR